MDFQLAAPPPDLAPWVAAGLRVALHGSGTSPVPAHFPALVEGGLTVVLEGALGLPCEEGGFAALPGCFVSGPRALPMTLYRTARLRCIGLRLHPAGMPALLGASPQVLGDMPARAGDVWGASWSRCREQIDASPGDDARLAVLFGFVRHQLREDARHLDRTRKAWHLHSAALDLAGAGARLGLTDRQFERRFGATFGLRPKLFQRVARLEGVLRTALATGRTDAQLALDHGYYDQSHLARDLRLLAGAPLGTLVGAVRANDDAYWPLAIGAAYRRCGVQPATAAVSFFS